MTKKALEFQSDDKVLYAKVLKARRLDSYNRGNQDYGDHLPTQYEVQIEGSSGWLKVFAICWSNAASLYVNAKGIRLFIHDYELQETLEKTR